MVKVKKNPKTNDLVAVYLITIFLIITIFHILGHPILY